MIIQRRSSVERGFDWSGGLRRKISRNEHCRMTAERAESDVMDIVIQRLMKANLILHVHNVPYLNFLFDKRYRP